ncbi:nucleotidyltransferase domain protein [Candidatus Magnetomorum sp. HK-1]|nr:nucleotidyltransferase domain protein [Candidatus Magnetomorum sp. HK-1]
MKIINENIMSSDNYQALKDLKNRLLNFFGIEKIILFGSNVRTEANEESDCDLLILTDHPLKRFDRHKITDAIFDINLLYGTNYSSLVVDRTSWESGPISVLPITEEIRRDGIVI